MKIPTGKATSVPLVIATNDTINIASGHKIESPPAKIVPIDFDSPLVVHHAGATQEGGNGDDVLGSTAGNDVLYGNGGKDVFFLADGSDRAYGGSGDDQFYIYNGSHTAAGGTGNDYFSIFSSGEKTLTGGAGADQYVFDRASNSHSTITDFNGAAGDRIWFDAPVTSVGWNADHTGIDFTLKNGGSISVIGADQDIYHYVGFTDWSS